MNIGRLEHSLFSQIRFGILPIEIEVGRSLQTEAWGAESSFPVAHPGYQVLSDILFRLGLIANALTQCSA